MADITENYHNLTAQYAEKNETIENLKLEVEKYRQMLFTRRAATEDMFLIYKSDFEEDNIDIIGRNIREFGELLYFQGYQLIARQESNLDFCIYLASIDDNTHLDKCIKMIENLIEKKREEEENVTKSCPISRILPELEINNKEFTSLKEQTAELNKKIERMMEETEIFRKERLEIEYVNKKRIEKINNFYGMTNIDSIRNSPELLENICNLMSASGTSNNTYSIVDCSPPFDTTTSLRVKKMELTDYFDVLQMDISRLTDIQKNMRKWFLFNWRKFLYKPSQHEIKETKLMFQRKHKLDDVIGTIHSVTITYRGRACQLIYAVFDQKILTFVCGSTKEEALSFLYNSLKYDCKWINKNKFITEISVPQELSHIFIKCSQRHCYMENENVVTFIWNNFVCLKYDNDDFYHHAIPIIYNFSLQYLEQSLE